MTKFEVLEAIRADEGDEKAAGVDAGQLTSELDLSEIATIRHLERLWAQRLIEPAGQWRGNPRDFVKDVASLRFVLTERGQERLRWRRRKELRDRR